MIGIVDYGMGNVGSVQRMFKKIGVVSLIANQPKQLNDVTSLIVPGVGAFDNAMEKLKSTGFLCRLNELVLDKNIPVLGICLGMQLLFQSSEEGQRPGLGWVRGKVVKFCFADKATSLPVPHMGWRDVEFKDSSGLHQQNQGLPRFYFVHSYHAVPDSAEVVIGTAEYGYRFCCAVRQGNVFGVQFHPEKSHRFGMQLLSKFVETIECES
jgi:glutamine amidotransferase